MASTLYALDMMLELGPLKCALLHFDSNISALSLLNTQKERNAYNGMVAAGGGQKRNFGQACPIFGLDPPDPPPPLLVPPPRQKGY